MKKTANQSNVLSKDDMKNSKPVSNFNSQPLNQLVPLSQNEPQSNNNESRLNQRGCKKGMANDSQSHHE